MKGINILFALFSETKKLIKGYKILSFTVNNFFNIEK